MMCNLARCEESTDPKYYCKVCNSYFCSLEHFMEHNRYYSSMGTESVPVEAQLTS